MKINNSDDFLLGKTQRIKPTIQIQNEIEKNGACPKMIKKFLATEFIENKSCALSCYVKAEGYSFQWGHILEDISEIEDDGKKIRLASWNFCLDDLLVKFHEVGLHLDDLSQMCIDVIFSAEKRMNFRAQIPDYITVAEGNKVSSFELLVFETAENDFNEISVAREWIVCCFLDPMLNQILVAVEKDLRGRK